MNTTEGSPKSRAVALALAIAVPCVGLHRFYVGKIGTGILMLATLGGLGIWWLYDVITLAAGSFYDVDGRRVKYWTEDETPDREAEPLLHEVVDELHALRGEVAELTERVDFTERLLTRARQDEAPPPVGSGR